MNPASREDREQALKGLGADDVVARRAAAEFFRAAFWERHLMKKVFTDALRAAMRDPDEVVALTCARALLAARWRFGDTNRIIEALEADLPRNPQLGAKIFELVERLDDPKVLEVLEPWLIARVSSPVSSDREVGRTGLATLANAGTDLGACVPGLVAALESSGSAEIEAIIELLYIAAAAQADTALAEPAVVRTFGTTAAASLRYRAARLTTVGRFSRGDAAGLQELTSHVDAAVREGATDALGALRLWEGFPERGVALLAAGLTDEAGGVIQGAVSGLLMAARDKVDLAQAYDAISAAIARGIMHRREGRVFPLDMIGSSDFSSDRAQIDLAEALVLSEVRHGSVERLATRPLDSELARRGVVQALKALEQDPALLVKAIAARAALTADWN